MDTHIEEIIELNIEIAEAIYDSIEFDEWFLCEELENKIGKDAFAVFNELFHPDKKEKVFVGTAWFHESSCIGSMYGNREHIINGNRHRIFAILLFTEYLKSEGLR